MKIIASIFLGVLAMQIMWMEKNGVKNKISYFEWLKKSKNLIPSMLFAFGYEVFHLKAGFIYCSIEYIIVFIILSVISYKYGWFWNWFTKRNL